MKRRFHQLDVFSAVPLKGNPLAVVHAAQGLDEATMAAFARWTHLSETTFLLPVERRRENFSEVEQSWTEQVAVCEAKRCLRCDFRESRD